MDGFGSPEALSASASGAGALISALDSGPSVSKQKRTQRELLLNLAKYEPELTRSRFDAVMSNAETHSLHPLVAMGINPSSGGGFSGTYGQKDYGRAGDTVSRAIQATSSLSKERQQAEIDLLKAQTAALGQKTPSQPSGMTGQDVPVPTASPHIGETYNPKIQEIRKGQVDTIGYAPDKNTSVVRPMTDIMIGSQAIAFPVEEADTLMEDPLAAAIGAALYHGNKNVDWVWAVKEYTQGKGLKPFQISGGTRRMFQRIERRKRLEIKKRSKHAQKSTAQRPGSDSWRTRYR